MELNQAPDGAQEFAKVGFLSPLPGLGLFCCSDPRFHRGLISVAPPALELREVAERRMEISRLRSGWNDSAKIILSPAIVAPKQREGGRDDGRMRISRRPFRLRGAPKRRYGATAAGRIMFWDANPARCAGLISSCPFGTMQS
jgi:hypothetical protein